jgi:hypothetical protein
VVYDGRMIKLLYAACLTGALLAGCGGGKSCEDLCSEAQAGNCTSIRGNCRSFCNALDGVQGPAGCTDEREAYQSCLDDGDNVCTNSCGVLENTLAQCLSAYCAQNQTNVDCQILVGSF